MDFFPDPPDPPDEDEDEGHEHRQPVWMGPPDDVLPDVVPVELVLGRSASTVVALTGMRAFPNGPHMNLAVRVRGPVARRDLNSEVFDGPYGHGMDAQWQAGRLSGGSSSRTAAAPRTSIPGRSSATMTTAGPTTRMTGCGNRTTQCCTAEEAAAGVGRWTGTTGSGRSRPRAGCASCASGRSRTSHWTCRTSTPSRSSRLPAARAPYGRRRPDRYGRGALSSRSRSGRMGARPRRPVRSHPNAGILPSWTDLWRECSRRIAPSTPCL